MIYMLDPRSKHALSLIGSIGFVNHETPFYNVVNKTNKHTGKPKSTVVKPPNIILHRHSLKIIRKRCGKTETMQEFWL